MARQITVSVPNANAGGGEAAWGQIQGTLSDQTDLNSALGSKANTSDVYTKTQVDDIVTSLNQFQYVAVTTLPTASASTMYKIYLVPNSGTGTNVKDEYITIQNVTIEDEEEIVTYAWELLGTTEIDLSNYLQQYSSGSTQWDTTPTDSSTKAITSGGVYTALAAKQDSLTAGTNVSISNNTISATDTTYSAFTGTDGTAAGTAGLVPAPATSDAGKFLQASGSWTTINTDKPFYYGTCSASSNVAIRSVTCSGFALTQGATIAIKFANGATVPLTAINVNSTGDVNVYLRYKNSTEKETIPVGYWKQGEIMTFTYDGNVFIANATPATIATDTSVEAEYVSDPTKTITISPIGAKRFIIDQGASCTYTLTPTQAGLIWVMKIDKNEGDTIAFDSNVTLDKTIETSWWSCTIVFIAWTTTLIKGYVFDYSAD